MFVVVHEDGEFLDVRDAGARELAVVKATSQVGVAVLEEGHCVACFLRINLHIGLRERDVLALLVVDKHLKLAEVLYHSHLKGS